MRHGDLTVADLHHWFGVPYPTMRSWALEGRAPRRGSPKGKLAERRMLLLETAINRGKGLPPPADISAHVRPGYVRQVRDGLERSSVSPRDPA